MCLISCRTSSPTTPRTSSLCLGIIIALSTSCLVLRFPQDIGIRTSLTCCLTALTASGQLVFLAGTILCLLVKILGPIILLAYML